jgi:predicted negative regulator of RcsB-dependent stress response
MKIFKFFIILSVVITVSYFSWGYFSRLNKEKFEKATLVLGDYRNTARISEMESLLCM